VGSSPISRPIRNLLREQPCNYADFGVFIYL